MKNNESQGLSPIFIREDSYSTNDDVNMVDLAIILVRHRKLFAFIFTLVVAVGVFFAMSQTQQYTFSSTIEIGSEVVNGTTNLFESPQTLLTKLQYDYIPQVLQKHRASNPGNSKNYVINTATPNGDVIIVLEITETGNEFETLSTLLKNISQGVIKDHDKIFNIRQRSLLTLANLAKSELKALIKNSGDRPEIIQVLKDRIEIYQARIISLKNTKELSAPTKSLDPIKKNTIRIVLLAAFVGVFLGIFSAFFAELVIKVKEKMKNNG